MALSRPDFVVCMTGPYGNVVDYKTDDGIATVQVANYFGPLAAYLPLNSRIFLTVLKSTTPTHYKLAVSASNPATQAVSFMIMAAFA